MKTSNGSDLRFAGRVVVVSPHLDDAVMSLGATIAKAVQSGTRIEVLTVFAYKPSSSEPAGPWDTRCGYETEGQAADSRRAEDRQFSPTILPFPRSAPTKTACSDLDCLASIWRSCTTWTWRITPHRRAGTR